jgi:hypothetical protein
MATTAEEYTCPRQGCGQAIVYDPTDKRHKTVGAALRANGSGRKIVVYLRCPSGHVSRFEYPR